MKSGELKTTLKKVEKQLDMQDRITYNKKAPQKGAASWTVEKPDKQAPVP